MSLIGKDRKLPRALSNLRPKLGIRSHRPDNNEDEVACIIPDDAPGGGEEKAVEEKGDLFVYLTSERRFKPTEGMEPIRQIRVKDALLFASSDDGHIYVWDLRTGTLADTINSTVRHMLVKDGLLFYSNKPADEKENNCIIAWDIKLHVTTHVFAGHSKWISCFDVKDGTVYSASTDKTVRWWPVPPRARGGTLLQASIDKQGDHVHQALKYWSASDSDKSAPRGPTVPSVTRVLELKEPVTALAIVKERKLLFTSSAKNVIHVWSTETGQLAGKLKGHEHWVYGVKLCSDGLLYSCSRDQTIRAWDIEKMSCVCVVNTHTNNLNSSKYQVAGNRLFAISEEKNVTMWDTKSGKLLRTFEGHRQRIRVMTIKENPLSEGGLDLFTASEDCNIRRWNVQNGTTIAIFSGHKKPINSLYIDTKDNLMYSCGDDGIVMEWNLVKAVVEALENLKKLNTKDYERQTETARMLTKLCTALDITAWEKKTGVKVLQSSDDPVDVDENIDRDKERLAAKFPGKFDRSQSVYAEPGDETEMIKTEDGQLVEVSRVTLGPNKLTSFELEALEAAETEAKAAIEADASAKEKAKAKSKSYIAASHRKSALGAGSSGSSSAPSSPHLGNSLPSSSSTSSIGNESGSTQSISDDNPKSVFATLYSGAKSLIALLKQPVASLEVNEFELLVLKLTKLAAVIAYMLPNFDACAGTKLELLSTARELSGYAQQYVKLAEGVQQNPEGIVTSDTGSVPHKQAADRMLANLAKLVTVTKSAMQIYNQQHTPNSPRPEVDLTASGTMHVIRQQSPNIQQLELQQQIEEEFPFFRVLQFCEPETTRLVKELVQPLSLSRLIDYDNMRPAVSGAAAVLKDAADKGAVGDWKNLLQSMHDLIKAVRAVVHASTSADPQCKRQILYQTTESVTLLSGIVTLTKNLRTNVYADEAARIGAQNTMKERAKGLLAAISAVLVAIKQLNQPSAAPSVSS